MGDGVGAQILIRGRLRIDAERIRLRDVLSKSLNDVFVKDHSRHLSHYAYNFT
jgi:hypothetical protein